MDHRRTIRYSERAGRWSGALWVAATVLLIAAPSRAQEPGGGPDRFSAYPADIRAVFDYDGLLTDNVTREYLEMLPCAEPPEHDPSSSSTVYRATIRGPRFWGYFSPDSPFGPTFCEDPFAPPMELESRITVEIRVPDEIPDSGFADPDSALVLVMKSRPPDPPDEETRPRKIARELAVKGVCSVVWWERDDNPFPCGGGVAVAKLSEQFGYLGDGDIQKNGHQWILHRYLNKTHGESLSVEEYRFDFRFAYAQAFLLSVTFFEKYLDAVVYPDDPNFDSWIAGLRICYAGGSKRGGGVTSAVMASGLLTAADPRNIAGLFVAGYQGLDADDRSGFDRYEADWSYVFGMEERMLRREDPCPPDPCPDPCPPDAGFHPYKDFALWVHQTRFEPNSYASACVPSQNTANLELLEGLLVLNMVGTHDWINPLGSHRKLFEGSDLDVAVLQRINRTHGQLVELGEWSASDLLIMRAMFNLRYRNDPVKLARHLLFRVQWVELDRDSSWTATLRIESDAIAGDIQTTEEVTVWVALSDDRDFRRCTDPIIYGSAPCFDSDPNGEGTGDPEDRFISVTPSSVVRAGERGDLRIVQFSMPPEYGEFSNPLVAVIVQIMFRGTEQETEIDDLMVTTWPEFVNEELYPAGLVDCQGIDDIDVLRVNGGSAAGTGSRTVIDVTGPIRFSIVKPIGGGNGKFIVHLNEGAPLAETISILPKSLGNICFPLLFSAGANPVCIFNSVGKQGILGPSHYFGQSIPDPAPAPSELLYLPVGDPAHLPLGSIWTLQGVIINPDAGGSAPASVTKATVLTVL